MRTNFQHYRKRRRVMPPAWHQAMAAHLARDMERRIALPERPADPLAGEEWMSVTVKTRHGSHTLTASIPAPRGIKRPRSDQFAVSLDGEPVAELEGYTSILSRVRALLPQMMTRKQRYESDLTNEFSAVFDAECVGSASHF